jgi:hypothetical protein
MRVFKRVWRVAALAMTIATGWTGSAIAQAPAPASSRTTPTSLANTYRSHIEFLANPFLEGRGPGTRGNEIAAEYIVSGFRHLGLTAPF